MHKRTWWMAVVVLGTVSLLCCSSKKTGTSTPDAGKIASPAGSGGTTSSTAGKSGSGAGAGGGTAGGGVTSLNVPCGDNMCAGAAPGTMPSIPGFSLANPCCKDATNGICGSTQTDMSCLVSPPAAPSCPSLFMGVLGSCCATGNLCGVDAVLMGRGCVDLMTVKAMIPPGIPFTIPSPVHCDGTPVAMPEADAGE